MSDDRTMTGGGYGGARGSGETVGGRYQILRQIGEGGMGEVFEGWDTEAERVVALKRPPREVWANPRGRDTFIREARIAERLNHPHIVSFLGLVDEGLGKPIYMVFEFIEGCNILEYMHKKQGPLEANRAVAIAIQACEGLQYAHEQGIVHRDIKPSNLMIDKNGWVKVADFGIARELQNTLFTLTGRTSGTLAYMPPEQELGQDKDPRVDIYALGATLYEMLAGRSPFAGVPNTLAAKRESAFVRLEEVNNQIPEEVAASIERCLEPLPEARPSSAEEFAAALKAVCADWEASMPEAPAQPASRARPAAAARKAHKQANPGEASGSLDEALTASTRSGDAQGLREQGRREKARRRLGRAVFWAVRLVRAMALLLVGRSCVPARKEAAPRQKQYAEKTGLPVAKKLDLGGGVKMKLVLIPPGEFRMGSNDGGSNEKPVHEVRITKAFYMAATEVTQAQYEAVMGNNPSHFKGKYNPVESVSWNDATEFCRKLSQKAGVEVSLPTEAQWEYACRAGTSTRYHFGDSDSQLGKYAWFDGNSGGKTHPVGRKNPNDWSLYDMHGNVWEWCQDWYGKHYYDKSPVDDPQGPRNGEYRVLRGGAWFNRASVCRSAIRFLNSPAYTINYNGFRVVSRDFQ